MLRAAYCISGAQKDFSENMTCWTHCDIQHQREVNLIPLSAVVEATADTCKTRRVMSEKTLSDLRFCVHVLVCVGWEF